MPYDVEAIRKRLKETQTGKFNDPDEFRPEKAKSTTEPTNYRFYILPPVMEGDLVKGGHAKRSMDQFFVQHGAHWIHDKPYPCPRVCENNDCEICTFGFDLLRELKDDKNAEEKRKAIVKQYMPTTHYVVNIFFTGHKCNPEDLRGTVKYFKAPKTCFDSWSGALMRDDAGDPERPKAHGVFFDEKHAYIFELAVLKSGKNNSYKTSDFLTTNVGPMIRLENGQPDMGALAKLLTMRHYLFDKLDKPDSKKISALAQAIIHGDTSATDGTGSGGGGFDVDENAQKGASKASGGSNGSSPGRTDDEEDVVTTLKESTSKTETKTEAKATSVFNRSLDAEAAEPVSPKSAPKTESAVAVAEPKADAATQDTVSRLLAQLDEE